MYNSSRFGLDHRDSGSGGGGAKRAFENIGEDDAQGAASGNKCQKRPSLASVVVEAVRMDSLQKLGSSLEPLLRKVVGEEVERAIARFVPNRLGARTPPKQIQEVPVLELRLDFTNKLSLPLFTGGKVEGESSLPIYIVLKDAKTGQTITTGPKSNAKLEVVVLDGDFANDDDEWTAEDFEANVVKERDGKRPLLSGDLNVTLKEGVGTLGDVTFTDNSSWIRSRKFRLGVRVAPGFFDGVRVRECKTDAFTVKDHRGELYKKHYPPHISDEVWRLDKIGKDGAFHKRLQEKKINTVEDFLRCYVMDRQGLRNTLGNGMSNKMWDATLDHAKTCTISDKLYVYYPNGPHGVGVIFNNIYELIGITTNNNYKSEDILTEREKVYVDKLVKAAYENWSSITEYDNPPVVSGALSKHAEMNDGNEGASNPKEQLTLMYSQSVGVPQPVRHYQMPAATNVSGTSVLPELYGYGAEAMSQYTSQENHVVQVSEVYSTGTDPQSNVALSSMNFHPAFGAAGNTETDTGLALATSQAMLPRSYGLYPAAPSQQGFQGNSTGWQRFPVHNPMTPAMDLYLHEEDIQAKALEFLENEDMQQLLRLQYSSNPENWQVQGEDAYLGFTPSPPVSFKEDGGRSSGKAYVGWLKLKAALRWGIFIRKIAAKKKAVQRAQLEEIED